MKSYAKRSLAFMLSVLMLMQVFALSLAADVEINITAYPDIDVILSNGITNIDTSNFEEDVISAFTSKGIPENKVKVSKVETAEVEVATSFTWLKDVSSSIGSISLDTTGQNITMAGNRSNPGKNALYCLTDSNATEEFQLGYSIDFGDSFNAAGMLLKVQDTGTNLKGYMLSFNQSGKTYYSGARSKLGGIWEFNWKKGTNSTTMSVTTSSTPGNNQIKLIQGLSISTSGTLNVKVTSDSIIISGGGMSTPVTVATANTYTGYGYGFFSDHYSHSCSRIGSFKLTAVGLTTTSVKTMTEILKAPDWRDNTLRLLVNVSDYEEASLTNATSRSELLSKTKNENIHYIVLGTETNREMSESFITDNDNKGLFVLNNPYNVALGEVAEYVKSFIDTQPTVDEVIVGMPTNIVVTPASAMKNTADSDYPNGKWYIKHNETHYENNTGKSEYDNEYQNNFVLSFDKPGAYEIYYKDELVKTVYAHRMPVADFTMQYNRSTKSITYTDNSYDLDNQSVNNGIQATKWSYKKSTDSTYTDGQLETVEDGVNYIIQLQVQDNQGTWSAVTSKTLDSSNTSPTTPIASFAVNKNTVSMYEDFIITDTSYDPRGYELIKYSWIVEKDGTQVATYSTTTAPKLNLKELGAGTYIIKLQVSNEKYTSDLYQRTVTVLSDTTSPTVVIIPTECDYSHEQVITVTLTDAESGVQGLKYVFTESVEEPSDEEFSELLEGDEHTLTCNQNGNWYLHVQGYDNDNNYKYSRAGLYKIDIEAPSLSLKQKGNESEIRIELKFTSADNGSGLLGYSYVIDELEDTIPDDVIDLDTSELILSYSYGGQYLHIKAIDNLQNSSETKTIQLVKLNAQQVGLESNQGKTDLLVDQEETSFSVIVPLNLVFHLTKNGEVETADNARIINDSYGPIKVIDIDVEPRNDWKLLEYDNANIHSLKVDSNKIAISIGEKANDEVLYESKTDENGLNFLHVWSVIPGRKYANTPKEQGIYYSAKITAMSEAILEENAQNVADVIFTIDWEY